MRILGSGRSKRWLRPRDLNPRGRKCQTRIDLADVMPDGWQFWRDWRKTVAPDNVTEIKAVEADEGRYTRQPLLRSQQ
jgi:hypothetical protein